MLLPALADSRSNMNRSFLWPALCLFLLLAIAVATIWGFTAGYIVTLWEEQTRSGVNEYLAIRYDGEPMIESYSTAGGVYRQLPQRTLDGQELPGPRRAMLNSFAIRSPRQPSWSDLPVTWNERIARMDRNKRWLVIHDGQHEGRAYIACYDLITKLPIGYIGRKGFSTSLPAAADQFAVGRPFWYDAQNIAGAGLDSFHMSYDEETAIAVPPWCIYLIDGDKLVEVDVRSRALRTLIDSGVQSIEIVQRPTPADDDELQNVSTDAWTGIARREPEELRLFVKLPESIAVLDPAADQRDDFKLPEQFRTGPLNLYVISPEQLLVSRNQTATNGISPGGPQRYTLTWLNNNGEQTEEIEAEVGGYVGMSDVASTLIGMLIVPVMVLGLLVAIWFAPISLLADGKVDSYGEGLRHAIEMTWPAGIVLLLICLAAAWLVLRWQKKYDRSHTVAWTIGVFFLGVPGLLAYMLVHGFPHRVSCPACGAKVPQRRDACAACRAPFPAPALKGTEVFA